MYMYMHVYSIDLRDSIADRVVGAHNVHEGGEERENVSVLGRDKVSEPAIVTSGV